MGGFKRYLTEMAQDPHKAGYQFHVIPDYWDGVHAIIAYHPNATPTKKDSEGNELYRNLPPHIKDHVVGHTVIQHKEFKASLGKDFQHRPHSLFVDPAHRCNGVASGMYDKYKEYTGHDVQPSHWQSDEAQALWKDRTRNLSEMAQDPHKAGYQFHVLHDWSGKGVHAVVATHPSATQETGNWGSMVPSVISNMSDMKADLPKSVQGDVVGYAEIQHRNGPYQDSADMLYVSPSHRRKGVAAGLYNKYQEYTGRPVKPSPDQTGAARSFWKDRRKNK